MKILHGSIWNIIGSVLPTLVAVPAFGFIARQLELEQLGIYTLFFGLVGYASLLDLGISKSVIREISRSKNSKNKIDEIISSATLVILILSGLGVIGIYFGASQIVDILNVKEKNIQIAIESTKVLSLTLIPLLLSSIWFSYLEGLGRFKELNKYRGLSGVVVAIMPALMVCLKNDLVYATSGLLVGRLITVLMAYCVLHSNEIIAVGASKIETISHLLSFGGWVTASNLIGGWVVYGDRFIMSNILGANLVAIYTMPSEMVSKLLLLPQAVSRTIFPMIGHGLEDIKESRIYARNFSIAISLIVTVFFIIFSREILTLWLGAALNLESVLILKVLLVGFFFHAISQVPFSEIHALGYANKTTKLYLLQILPYLILVYLIAKNFGMLGVAVLWSTRMVFEWVSLKKIMDGLSSQLNSY